MHRAQPSNSRLENYQPVRLDPVFSCTVQCDDCNSVIYPCVGKYTGGRLDCIIVCVPVLRTGAGLICCCSQDDVKLSHIISLETQVVGDPQQPDMLHRPTGLCPSKHIPPALRQVESTTSCKCQATRGFQADLSLPSVCKPSFRDWLLRHTAATNPLELRNTRHWTEPWRAGS